MILDPHSERRKEGYLEKQMKNQHDTRITLKINRKSVEKYQNQFLPFDQICGWKIDEIHGGILPGTLMRFPLRSNDQAKVSKICGNHYIHEEIVSLFKTVEAQLKSLLLFTQNVRQFSVLSFIPNQIAET